MDTLSIPTSELYNFLSKKDFMSCWYDKKIKCNFRFPDSFGYCWYNRDDKCVCKQKESLYEDYFYAAIDALRKEELNKHFSNVELFD